VVPESTTEEPLIGESVWGAVRALRERGLSKREIGRQLDLDIKTVRKWLRQQWEPQFEKAARLRDSLERGTEEYENAQAKVEECYGKMYERGYFRDPYNDWDLLWKFGLSWGNDVIPMLDANVGCQLVKLSNS
jgi:transcriptional regulator with XRE-family HTH domain